MPDLHGNIVAAIGSDATFVNALRFDPYGQTVATWTASSGSVNLPWRYQGRILESAGTSTSTDLYDFQARSYDPSLGGFTSLDSVAGSAQNPLTLNRYLYANANPGTLVDPDGHCAYSDHYSGCETEASIKDFTDGIKKAKKAKEDESKNDCYKTLRPCPGSPDWNLRALWNLARAQQTAEREYCNESHACFAQGADPSLMQDPTKSYLILGGHGECTAFMAAFHCDLPDRLPIPGLVKSGVFSEAADLLEIEALDAAAAEAALMEAIPGETAMTEAAAVKGWAPWVNVAEDFDKHGELLAAKTAGEYALDAQNLLPKAIESGLPTKVSQVVDNSTGLPTGNLKMTVQDTDGTVATYNYFSNEGVWKPSSYFMPTLKGTDIYDPSYFLRQSGVTVDW